MDPQSPCLINCELFGKGAGFFESAIVPLWQDIYDSLVSRATVAEGATALDIGTGTGEVALRLAKRVGIGGRVVAIDTQMEMLDIARRKARHHDLLKIEFKLMSMENNSLPGNSFDSVVGNYSLCCCVDYKASLAECLRVLKPGGRLTYNHNGPVDTIQFKTVSEMFERYKTRTPSRRLKEVRASNDAQVEAFRRYRDPFVTLDLIRSLGYAQAEATVTRRVLRYHNARSYVDEWLSFDWRPEAEEIPSNSLKRFRKEAMEAIGPLSKGPGFSVESDMVFFTALKP